MQNSPSLRKWTELKGLATVTLDDGKKAGTVENFFFDTQTNTVLAFIIKTGLFTHHAVMAGQLKSIGVDALTVPHENALVKEDVVNALATAPRGEDVLKYRVLSESGTVVGTIGNMVLDVSNPASVRIVSYELAAGIRSRLSGHYPSFDANRIKSYGHDVIVIPDNVASPLLQQ